jgi:aminotransferase
MEVTGRGRALGKVEPLIKDSDQSPMAAMKRIMQDQPDIVNMAIGEANFDPPAALVDIACSLLQDKVDRKSLYTPIRGLPTTRQAVARFLKRHFDADVDPEENILMSVGGTEALNLAITVLIKPGDKVLLPDPGWGPMMALMQRRGANIDFYPLGLGTAWYVDPEAILDKMDSSVKILVVNSPSNPTGAMLTDPAAWKRIMEKAKELDIFVFSDEVYHAYTYEGTYPSALKLDPSFENLLVVNSFSKSFAVMGWRLGYVITHPWLIKQMDVTKETVSACAPSIAQWAFADYLDDGDGYLENMRDMCKQNMEKMVARLNAMPGVRCPKAQGGFYLFPDFSGVEPDSQQMAMRLLRNGVAVAKGAAFGPHGEGFARLLCSAHWENIEKALDRIEKAVRE